MSFILLEGQKAEFVTYQPTLIVYSISLNFKQVSHANLFNELPFLPVLMSLFSQNLFFSHNWGAIKYSFENS